MVWATFAAETTGTTGFGVARGTEGASAASKSARWAIPCFVRCTRGAAGQATGQTGIIALSKMALLAAGIGADGFG